MLANFSLAVAQHYETEVHNLYVIRGNSAVLKCEIPSFVADFLEIVAWLDESHNSYVHSDNTAEGLTRECKIQ